MVRERVPETTHLIQHAVKVKETTSWSLLRWKEPRSESNNHRVTVLRPMHFGLIGTHKYKYGVGGGGRSVLDRGAVVVREMISLVEDDVIARDARRS